MRVVIVAPFAPNAEGSLESSYKRAFQYNGAQVEAVSTLSIFGPRPLGGHISPLLNAYRKQHFFERTILACSPTLVVLIKGLGILPKTLLSLRKQGVRVVNVFPDNPFEIARNSPLGVTLIPHLRAADNVYVHDRRLVWQLNQAGVNAKYLSFARDHDLQDPASATGHDGQQSGIVFVGNPDSERIRYLSSIADLGLRLYGAWDWAKLPPTHPLSGCIAGTVHAGRDMTRMLRQARLSINILRHSQKTAHNMRTFESPGSGVCTVSERSIGVLSLMRDGQDVVTFSTPSELRDVCLRLLDDQQEVDAIARSGFEHIEHETYKKRAAQILGD